MDVIPRPELGCLALLVFVILGDLACKSRFLSTEFLNVPILQSHYCAKCLGICTKFGLMNVKQDKLTLISCFCHNLTIFKYF